MRKRARKCPLCGIYMTSRPNLPNSKHLDHILPRNQGGTHTLGNGRIICASCNMRRPKDGSDYTGPLTLWAQGPVPVSQASGQGNKNVDTCRNGLHPWIPANIMLGNDGRHRCALCYKARNRKYPLRQCACGTLFAAAGRTFMCPACVEVTARKAAELHARGGLSWSQVAAEVGYGTAEGARYAAGRIGYKAGPKPAQPKPARPCPDCGEPKRPGTQQCQPCAEARAWRAVEMRRGGMTLRAIADTLGLASVTSVTNLMKTVVEVEVRMGRPRMVTNDDVHSIAC